jgi:hypothetical protein
MERRRQRKVRLVFTLLFGSVAASPTSILDFGFWILDFGHSSNPKSAIQNLKSDSLTQWQPNEAPANAQYVGSSRCVQCHTDKTGQPSSLMGKASESVDECQVLRAHPLLTLRLGGYSYKIAREGNRSLYTVTDGKSTFSVPILYCFGHGKGGQTYIFQHRGAFYESRVSFYPAIKGLDLTRGAQMSEPQSVEEAAGKRMNPADARSCFGCHTTGAATKSDVQVERLIHGITCESCHGLGEKHVAAVTWGKFGQRLVFNPAVLEAEEMSTFCGSCHRTWEQVVLMQQAMRRNGVEMGKNSVRFQPYRLALSPCYDMSDKRISCTACHDPHRDPEHAPAFYDARCTACHTSDKERRQVGNRVAKTCRVATQKCVTCHMPKTELPGSHTAFADHFIRVVKSGESVW